MKPPVDRVDELIPSCGRVTAMVARGGSDRRDQQLQGVEAPRQLDLEDGRALEGRREECSLADFGVCWLPCGLCVGGEQQSAFPQLAQHLPAGSEEKSRGLPVNTRALVIASPLHIDPLTVLALAACLRDIRAL